MVAASVVSGCVRRRDQLRGTTPQGTTPTGAHTSECGGRLLSLLLFPCHSRACVKKACLSYFLFILSFLNINMYFSLSLQVCCLIHDAEAKGALTYVEVSCE